MSAHHHTSHHGHAHGHDHDHAHTHVHETTSEGVLTWAIALTLGFMVIEFTAGLIAHSLALMADAGHMLTDAAALALAWAALRFNTKPADARRSFGYKRLQVLATFVNGFALFAIVGWIALEAIQRLLNPGEVNARVMLVVGGLGAVVNVVVFLMLRGREQDNINIAAASLHVLGDLLGSVAAVVAAVAIAYTQWTPIDPILSLLVSLLIVRSAWSLVRRSAHILLEGAPDWLNIAELRAAIEKEVPSVRDIHHVHCWSLGTAETLITLHAAIDEGSQSDQVLSGINTVLAERYGINHATIQLESSVCSGPKCAT